MSLLPGKLLRIRRDEYQSKKEGRAPSQCRCSLSFSTLIRRPEEDAVAHSSAHHGASSSIQDYLHVEPQPLAPQFTRTADSATVPLHRCEVHRLITSLPQQFHHAQWIPIFDTKVDGYSLPHFYRTLHDYREARPHVKAAIGFFEVLTREQWEVAAAAAEQPEQHQISSNERFPSRVSIFEDFKKAGSDERSRSSGMRSPVNRLRSPVASRPFVTEMASLWAAHSSPKGNQGKEVAKFSVSSPQPPAPTQAPNTTKRTHTFSSPSVIGVFTPQMPTLEFGPHRFFGSRDTSVFAFTQTATEKANLPRHFRYHKWSGKNEEFLICSPHFLGIGGGEEGAALYIDEEIQFGTSTASCPTFGPCVAVNALAVEKAMQRVGGDTTQRDRSPSSPSHSPLTPYAPALFGTKIGALNQSEFFIVRMQWFAIDDTRYVELCTGHEKRRKRSSQSNPLNNASVPPSSVSKELPLSSDKDESYTISPAVWSTILADVGMLAEGARHGANECNCGGMGSTAVHKCLPT